MAINKEANVGIKVDGAEAGQQAFANVGNSAKKAGLDIASAFKAAGAAVSGFGASVVDAVVDVGKLDAVTLTKTLEDYTRTVTKTAIASGQSIEGLTAKYRDLSRANGVMPQQIDAFAKSVGRLTYDIKGAQDAFTGAHNAALAFGETDQEQVPLVAMLHNVMGVAGDTRKEIGKLFSQANALGTVGGPRALKDLILDLAPAIDATFSRFTKARGEAVALAGVLTAGMTKQRAASVAGNVFGFLQANKAGIRRELGPGGKDELDEEGNFKSPTRVLQKLFANMKGRGMTEDQILRAWENATNTETAFAMMKLARGGLKKVAGIAGLESSDQADKAGAAYLESTAGKLDAGYVNAFHNKTDAAGSLLDIKSYFSEFVGEHPFISAGAAAGIKFGLTKAAQGAGGRIAGRIGGAALSGGLGAAGTVLGPLAGQMLFPETAGSGSELSSAPLQELIAGHSRGGMLYEPKAKQILAGEELLRSRGKDPATMNAKEIAAEIAAALQDVTLKVQNQDTPAATTESDKDPGSRN